MITIREKHRRGYRKEAGGYTEWTEWQVLSNRKVARRFDFEVDARAYAKELSEWRSSSEEQK